MSTPAELVESHYAGRGLLGRVREALRQSGLDPDRLNQTDLEKVDHFHVGGLDATDALARMAAIQKSDRVLDLGSGIGGPSRHLASTIGCHVAGIDLTDEYCQVAIMLAKATGLDHLVTYRRGDALATPFEDGAFDVAWTQHTAMNIEDKASLYREISRVLKKDGRLALHDVISGAGTLKFPVPWARKPELSFLISEETLLATLRAAGFREISLNDVTQKGLDALRQSAAKPPAPGFGVHTIMGPRFPGMVANLAVNLDTGTCRVVQVLAAK